MNQESSTREVDRFAWHQKLECVVEIVGQGHFPSTAIVKLPDGREIDTDLCDLIKRGLEGG